MKKKALRDLLKKVDKERLKVNYKPYTYDNWSTPLKVLISGLNKFGIEESEEYEREGSYEHGELFDALGIGDSDELGDILNHMYLINTPIGTFLYEGIVYDDPATGNEHLFVNVNRVKDSYEDVLYEIGENYSSDPNLTRINDRLLSNARRNNPMKRSKNPSIDGTVLVENMKGLRQLIKGQSFDKAVDTIMPVLTELNELGIRAWVHIQKGELKDYQKKKRSYKIAIFQSSMGTLVLVQVGRSAPKLVYADAQVYDLREIFLDQRDFDYNPLDDIRYISDKELAKHTFIVSDEDMYYLSNPNNPFFPEQDPSGMGHKIGGHARVAKHHPDAKMRKVHKRRMKATQKKYQSVEARRKKGVKVKQRKKNTAEPQLRMLRVANPITSIDEYGSFVDKIQSGNVFVGRTVVYVDDMGELYRLRLGDKPKLISPEIAFYADLAAEALYVGQADIDDLSDQYRDLIRDTKKLLKSTTPTTTTKKTTIQKESAIQKALIANFEKPNVF